MRFVTARFADATVRTRDRLPSARRSTHRVRSDSQPFLTAIGASVAGRQPAERQAHADPLPPASRNVRLFGIDIVDTRIEAATRWILERAVAQVPTRIAFVNAHCINVSYRNPAYRQAVASADCVLADGSGVAIAARVNGVKLKDNVNGTDLFPVLCEHAAAAGTSIFLFGGREGIAGRAAERMQRDNPKLQIAGTHHGFVVSPRDEEKLIAAINESGAQILLVGLGVPAQELWIARNRHRLGPAVVIGVGGLFDYYSDRIPRSPMALRALGLEWVWRLAMEPTRLARRYLLGNIEFLARLAWLTCRQAAGGEPRTQSEMAA